MKKHIFGLLCLFAMLIVQAQEVANDGSDVYKYTDLTKQQVEKVKEIESLWRKKMSVMTDKSAYLILSSQQQNAIDSLLNPAQQKKYRNYKMMKEATGWINKNVSLSKEQQEKMALVCLETYGQLDTIAANDTMDDYEKKIQCGKLFSDLSEKMKTVLTPKQKRDLDEVTLSNSKR